jgi:hypothetical protein
MIATFTFAGRLLGADRFLPTCRTQRAEASLALCSMRKSICKLCAKHFVGRIGLGGAVAQQLHKL